MKQFLITILLALSACLQIAAQAQESQVKITLKNGSVIKAELKEFNPAKHVTVRLGGQDITIGMDEIDTVETFGTQTPKAEQTPALDPKAIGQYRITDTAQYPDTILTNINGIDVELVLIRGGIFNMGYDSDGSLDMDSEPIHPVQLSSYYISTQPINDELATQFIKIYPSKEKNQFTWKMADNVVKAIANQTGKPYRMLTEAEWEYASLMPNAEQIWGQKKFIEWCSDYFAEYGPSMQIRINPTGPITGGRHVCRSFRKGNTKWDRHPGRGSGINEYYFRIAISAEEVLK